jgi:type II secretory pathway component PulM
MNQQPSNTKIDQHLERFRNLLDPIPFEAVITWVYQAPEPKALKWWQRLKSLMV